MPTRAPRHQPHRHRAPRSWSDQRGTAAARGYGWSWRKLRAHVLSIEPLCRECTERGRTTAATEVDHITPKHQGGSDEIENLQPLCQRCHALKTAREGNASPHRAR